MEDEEEEEEKTHVIGVRRILIGRFCV